MLLRLSSSIRSSSQCQMTSPLPSRLLVLRVLRDDVEAEEVADGNEGQPVRVLPILVHAARPSSTTKSRRVMRTGGVSLSTGGSPSGVGSGVGTGVGVATTTGLGVGVATVTGVLGVPPPRRRPPPLPGSPPSTACTTSSRCSHALPLRPTVTGSDPLPQLGRPFLGSCTLEWSRLKAHSSRRWPGPVITTQRVLGSDRRITVQGPYCKSSPRISTKALATRSRKRSDGLSLLISRDKLSLRADPDIVARSDRASQLVYCLNGLTGLNKRSVGLDTRANRRWPCADRRLRSKSVLGIAVRAHRHDGGLTPLSPGCT